MRKFGGTGRKKKGCVQRQCISTSDVSMTTYTCNYDGLCKFTLRHVVFTIAGMAKHVSTHQ